MPTYRTLAAVSALALGACAPPATVAERVKPMRLMQHPPVEVVEHRDVAAKSEPTQALPKTGPLPVRPELLTDCERSRSIVIYKADRVVELHCGSEVAARHNASLGFAPTGDKQREGDGRTPEGTYYITNKFFSRFHRSLELGYPNAADATRGLAEGQISKRQHDTIVRAIEGCRRPPQTTGLGSLLQVHGGGGGEWAGDWTLGCVALDNRAIEQVYAFHLPGCQDGKPNTPVHIRP